MELKPQNFYIGCKRYRVLLIVPYGIETPDAVAPHEAGTMLLIVPYGIETNLLISVLVSLQHF